MKISRDVVRDLLPLYAAGEASADTRALVEEFLGQDAELARLFETARQQQATLRGMAEGAVSTAQPLEAARSGLRQTQRLIALRTWLLAAAVFFTLLPGSFRFSGETIVWLMWRDLRPAAELSLALGALSWIGFIWSRRRLSVTGL